MDRENSRRAGCAELSQQKKDEEEREASHPQGLASGLDLGRLGSAAFEPDARDAEVFVVRAGINLGEGEADVLDRFVVALDQDGLLFLAINEFGVEAMLVIQ